MRSVYVLLIFIFPAVALLGSRVALQRIVCLRAESKDTLLVPDGVEKQRLDAFLSNALPKYSRSYFADLCEKGNVVVNDIPKGKNYKLSAGDVVGVTLVEKEVSAVTPENIPLDILFEDDYIIAINKPAGMVVHPAVGSPNGTFVNALLYHLGPDANNILAGDVDQTTAEDELEEFDLEDLPETPEAAKQTPISMRPGIVHRLDKGTSGVLIGKLTSHCVALM